MRPPLPQATQPKPGCASPSHNPQPHTNYTRLVHALRGQGHYTETRGTEHPDTATRTASNLQEAAATLFSLSYTECRHETGRQDLSAQRQTLNSQNTRQVTRLAETGPLARKPMIELQPTPKTS